MRTVWTLARRELRSYFDHPTAYVLVVAFLALAFFLTFRSMYAQRIATLRPLFDLLPWLFAVFIPAITMRSLAEERRSHTLEWLLAQPLAEVDVIIGKFLGDWLFVLVALAGSVPVALGILLVSDADAGQMFAQYIGAALLSAQGVAIGLWASSITRNQITAFILAATVSFVLVLAGLSVVLVGLPPTIGGIVARLSVVPHFENVARGVVDLRDVLYFVSTAALFLVLSGIALARERLSRSRGAWRRLRIGGFAVAAGVIVLNLLGGYLRGRLDLTRDSLYTLAPGTRSLVRGLDDIVQVKLFVSKQLPPEVQILLRDVRDLLRDMQRASNGLLVVTERNPDTDEAAQDEARSLGITPIEFSVLRDDQFQLSRGWFGVAVVYADAQRAIPLVDRTDDLEFRLASYIAGLTTEEKPTIAFATGYGAKGAYEFGPLRDALTERYEVTAVNLQQDTVAPVSRDSVQVLVIAAPTQQLDSAAVNRIREFIDAGGSALVLLESAQLNPQFPQPFPVQTGLEPLLTSWGVGVSGGFVFDLRSHANVSMGRQGFFSLVRGYPLWPIAQRAEEHATTRELENLSLGWATALTVLDTTRATPLWITSRDAGTRAVEMPIDPASFTVMPTDSLDVQVVALAVDAGADSNKDAASRAGRLIVVGDADFLSDNFVRANPQNLLFAANALDWLAQDETLIRIRAKNRTPPTLVFESDFQRAALKWGNLVGVPLLFIGIGAFRIAGRRARAERRWAGALGTESAPAAQRPARRARETVEAGR